MSVYSVKEIFGPTLQGEGFHAGRVAVFVRFAGCNLWSGIDNRREDNAQRNAAQCPRWCDTDFRGGEHLEDTDIVDRIREVMVDPPLIVLTGGEPLLQVNRKLIDRLLVGFRRSVICIETNGTRPLPFKYGLERTWVTMSPKVAPSALQLTEVDEVKVVFPAYDPAQYLGVATRHRFVSPQAHPTGLVGIRGRMEGVEHEAALYCLRHPDWRLSLQTHKVLGIP